MNDENDIKNEDEEEFVITRRDVLKYIQKEKLNTKMMDKKRDEWEGNIYKNREFYMNGNCQIPGMVIFIVAPGPSLKKNVNDLKLIPKNGRGMILCVDAAMSYLLDNDIVPDFCMSIDSDERMWNMVNNFSSVDMDTSKIVLLTTIFSNTNLISKWKGPKYIFNIISDMKGEDNLSYLQTIIRKSNRDIKKDEYIELNDFETIFNGLPPMVDSGGNVTTTSHSFALSMMAAWKVVLVGHDLSWSEDKEFYVDGINKKMGDERVEKSGNKWEHPDINGYSVTTNTGLWLYKDWHERYSAIRFPDRTVNATEGGIIGIEQNGNINNTVEIMTLKDSIDKYIFYKGFYNE